MKNKLGLRRFPLSKLRVNDSVLVGPYKNATMAATWIARNGLEGARYRQKQMILLDPGKLEAFKMYLVMRVS